MITETQGTALDRKAVESQIQAWFALGLPAGAITFDDRATDTVFLGVGNPALVVVWAKALGQDEVHLGFHQVWASAKPVDLPGWSLDVWCKEPIVPTEQRIATRAGVPA